MAPIVREPIAIVGSGCRFPGDATSPSKLWELLREPQDVSRKIDRFPADSFYNKDAPYHGTSNVQEAYLLSEDPSLFDAQFFGMQAGEAEAVDPQQRLLLETVYESLENAGLPLEDLRGSNTAVYVGVMCDDYSSILFHDLEAVPTYAASGIARSILSNRVSYVFDWRGPSMTIDTACSSSLVAVHQAIQVLRDGTSKMAVAAGANLIFSPNMFIAESNLYMLSRTGKSQMWDANANGYARGEGLAAIVLKTLDNAIADGDHIECIIRETGINQDGHTPGITVPSQEAQTALIRETYARAGLDLRNPADRPQYFEAHGTGTQAGDGVESEAIYRAFFPSDGDSDFFDSLAVGSIKTIIGHTEGTAGIAGVMKAFLAVQNNEIPPNLHFNTLNPTIKPFYGALKIPVKKQDWPALPQGSVRRASVNSFGFGGANAHAIIEAYEPSYYGQVESKISASALQVNALPLELSATSEKSLANLIAVYMSYLEENPDLDLRNLSLTLHNKRSAFPYRTCVSAAQSSATLIPMLRQILDTKASGDTDVFTRGSSETKRLLGVFTGQGAQWATMGRDLISTSKTVERIIDRMEKALNDLPLEDQPPWSLKEQLLVDPTQSRIAEAELSQPLCTAIQVVIVDLLRQAGVSFDAVVGHSSGEIGAAYAAGFISATDAIIIAYYRGRCSYLSRGLREEKGAMLAVGTSIEDAQDFCNLPGMKGRAKVAAHNSSSSVTLSGDNDAIQLAKEVFDDEQKFRRILKVDTAYHSHHMLPCSTIYRRSLAARHIQVLSPVDSICHWYSSVHDGKKMEACEELQHSYWVDNMVKPVLFSKALERALSGGKAPNMVIEVGPHSALKGPASSVVEEVLKTNLPYLSTLTRGKNDVGAIASTIGSIWEIFGRSAVDLDSFDKVFCGEKVQPLRDLPSYPWNHERSFWYESRGSRMHRLREEPPLPLLGTKASTNSEREHRWRNYISPRELPWLVGHKIQGQVLFPAAGFLVMAVEAARSIAGKSHAIRLVELLDSRIHHALGFNDDKGIETLFILSNVAIAKAGQETKIFTADFACEACLNHHSGSFISMASGKVKLTLGETSSRVLMDRPEEVASLVPVPVDLFYSSLADLGYNYSDLFRGIARLKRATNISVGDIFSANTEATKEASFEFLLHPAALDVAFQAIFAAISYPGDGALWTLHIPTGIRHVAINPINCPLNGGLDERLGFSANCHISAHGSISGDVDLFPEHSSSALAQIEGLEVTPLSPPTEKDDRQMFAEYHHFVDSPEAGRIFTPFKPTAEQKEDAQQLERFCLYHLKKSLGSMKNTRLRDWAQHVIDVVASGQHPTCRATWLMDTWEDAEAAKDTISSQSIFQEDLRRTKILTEKLEVAVIESSTQDKLLQHFYQNSFGASKSRQHLALMVQQVLRRYPHLNILELFAGDCSAAEIILPTIEGSFTTYTCSDNWVANLVKAEEQHQLLGARYLTKTLDIDEDLEAQGLSAGSFGLIIVANGFDRAKDPTRALRNTRFLLKPGGYLLMLQVTNPQTVRVGIAIEPLISIEGNSGKSSCMSLNSWDALLRSTGFSGVDTTTPDLDVPFSVFASQAVDTQINSLRQPLDSSIKIDHLLLIGGQQFGVCRMLESIQTLLEPFCENVTTIKCLDDLQMTTLAAKPIVLSLTELDSPFFVDLTEPRFQAMQRLFDRSKLILWVTEGAQGSNPYGNMIAAVFRCLVSELPHLFAQTLNIESQTKPHAQAHTIAEALLRLKIVDTWKGNYEPLWSVERELESDGVRLKITRYLPNFTLDKGYNTMRRSVIAEASLDKQVVSVVADKSSYALQQFSVAPIPELTDLGPIAKIFVRHSILCSLKIKGIGHFYLSSGVDQQTSAKFLVLSESNQSTLTVPKSRLLPIKVSDAEERCLLLTMAYSLVADSVLEDVTTSSAIILHEPSPLLAQLVADKAFGKGINATFTTTTRRPHSTGENWTCLHPHLPERMIQKLIPRNLSAFVVCANDDVHPRISTCLPFGVHQQDITEFFGHRSLSHSGVSKESLHEILDSAYTYCSERNFRLLNVDVEDVPLPNVSKEPLLKKTIRTINWVESPKVPARVTSAMDEATFTDKKTYFLIGMTGSLGLSTCLYMLSRGAKHFALASRNPKIDQQWLEMVRETYGAVVHVYSLDITNRKSLQSVHKSIVDSMPPIGGVANASLVIRDGLLVEMNYESVNQSLGPKIDGSIFLDELFPNNDLEFFILFSSLCFVTGNPGQSAYCAGNAFMVSLTKGRRQRGLVGSIMNLAGISGVGFITRTDHSILARLDIQGYGVMSERDYLYFWAEAVIAGPVDSGRDPVISCGLRYVDPKTDKGVPKWTIDTQFGHYKLDRSLGSSEEKAGENAESMHSALLEAQSKKEAYEIILDHLLAMLHKKLRMPPEESVQSNMAIVEMGVDSLVAVEMRSWFTHELELDIPAIKILGGATLANLAEDALERIAPEKVPNLKGMTIEAADTPAKPGSHIEALASSQSSSQEDSHGDSTNESMGGFTMTPPEIPMEDIDGDARILETKAEPTAAEPAVKSRPAFVRMERMSYGSARFWFLRKYLQSDTCFNIVFQMRMTGQLDRSKGYQVVRKLGNRHEAFRTAFFQDDVPMQGIMPESLLRLEAKRIDDENEAIGAANDLACYKFNVESGEVIRMLLFSISPEDHILVIGAHHIAVDGFSFNIILSELDLLYRDQPMALLKRQFVDFAVQQRRQVESGQLNKELNFWKTMYPDIPAPLPLFPLAGVRARLPLTNYAHKEAIFKLDQTTANKIRALCREHRSTTFHFFLATLRVFLFRWLHAEDICVGIADANRKDANTLSTVGCLLNLLPLRFAKPKDRALFRDVLSDTRKIVYQSLENSKVPFDVLLEELGVPRSSTYTPMFQAFLDYRQFSSRSLSLLKCKAEGEQIETGTAYDIVLSLIDIAGSDISINLQTQKSLYTAEHAEILLQSFIQLIKSFSLDFKIEITNAPLFSEEKKRIALQLGEGPTLSSDWPETLSHRIDVICDKYPKDIALRDGLNSTMTYREMSQRVDAVSDLMLTAKVLPGAKVAVFQEPSALWVCSLLAIWRVGGTYLPLDRRNGIPRLASIVSECKPDVILFNHSSVKDIPSLGAGDSFTINLDAAESLEPFSRHPNKASASSTAVIFFTSGSTGTPKGIEIRHANLVNVVEGYSKTWEVGRPNVLQQSAYSFDVSLDQIITGLTSGGSVYVASASQRQDPREIARIIVEDNITHTKATSSEYINWVNHGNTILSKAHKWSLADSIGEAWTQAQQIALRSLRLNNLRVQNYYGPAETSIACTKIPIDLTREYSDFPVGPAMPNYSIYVIDKQLNILPVGVIGEILIGGAGTGVGYFNRPGFTKEKFVVDPYARSVFIKSGWNTAYRSGDKGYLQPDGSLVCCGRIGDSTQVKLRGVRIELEDIESTIVKSSAGRISRAVASVRGESDSRVLVAFIEFASSCAADERDTTQLLSSLPLPQYMCPALLIPFAAGVPVNLHNKIDRVAVNEMPIPEASASDAAPHLTPTELTLKEIWIDLLPGSVSASVTINRGTSFFQIGGNSLLLLQLQNRVRETLGIFVSVVEFVESKNLAELASRIDGRSRSTPIDWDRETALEQAILSITGSRPSPTMRPRTVLLTGATGFTGRHILETLALDKSISRIHCVAVRSEEKLTALISPSSKIIVHPGNLAEPRLGLSETSYHNLVREMDVIIHSGAGRSFWYDYEALRTTNVQSTKELVNMSTQSLSKYEKVVPIHYLSSGEQSRSHPPTDGSNGYISSKWVSEKYLENAAKHLHLPVYIHRMLPANVEPGVTEKEQVFQEIAEVIARMKSIPSMTVWRGKFDLVPVQKLAQDILRDVLSIPAPGISYQSHHATIRITMDDVIEHISTAPGFTEGRLQYREILGHEWVGEAKKAGLTYQFMTMDMFLQNDMGETVGQIQR